MHQIDIVLGDWSNDGHGKSKHVSIMINKTKFEMQKAYKASCEKLLISFDNHNFTGIKRDWRDAEKYQIAAEYDEYVMTKEVARILFDNNCPIIKEAFDEDGEYSEEGFYLDEDNIIELLMWFIQQSLPDFEWTKNGVVKPEVFNGYWDENLNIQIGYGLFGN